MRSKNTIIKKHNEIIEKLHAEQDFETEDRDTTEQLIGAVHILKWVLGEVDD